MIDFFRQRMNGETDQFASEVLDCAKVNSTYYLAVRYTDKAAGTSSVGALVCLTATQQGMLGCKSIHESMGPVQQECPERILRQLSSLKPGDRLLFNEPISFQQGNLQLREFQMLENRKLVFRAEHGCLVRLTRDLIAGQENYSILRDGKVILDNRKSSAFTDEVEVEACNLSPR
ncbi:MAG: hypothetical protein PHC98_11015 [Syntrophotalea acetylenica]|nr:hypothetical protein [Syntrophotalea acetylenica]